MLAFLFCDILKMRPSRYLYLISVLLTTYVPMVWARCPYEVCKCIPSEDDDISMDCSNKDLNSLPALITGDDVMAVTDLYIGDNKITKIPDNSLPSNLKVMDFSNNPISGIASHAFAGSSGTLNKLSFSNAKFNKLPEALQELNNFTELTIAHTHITEWDEALLKYVGFLLQTLNLENIGLISWPEWFQNFQSLTTVSVANDFITSLPDDAFSKVKDKLESLSITYANLSEVPSALAELTHLQEVCLDGNSITQLTNIPKTQVISLRENKLFSSTNLIDALLPVADILWSLSLQSNEFTEIPDFSKMSKLEEVYLGRNQISDHTSGSFPASVSSLYLEMNNLTSIPQAVAGITNLSKLVLASNQITEITPGSLPAKLDILDLSSNKLTTIAAGAIPPSLSELDLRNNAISQISEKMFPADSSLAALTLTGNPIVKIEPLAFQSIQHLQRLALNYTDLTEIPVALKSLAKLKSLDLSGISTLTCICPVDSELHQWFAKRSKDKESHLTIHGYCYDVVSPSYAISSYLGNASCPLPPGGTTMYNMQTPDSSTHIVDPIGSLACDLSTCLLLCTAMALSALVMPSHRW